jgi:hypothetical protein
MDMGVATILTRSAKNKGKRLQKEVAAMVKKHIESQTGLTLDPRDVQSNMMSEAGVDVKLSPLAEKYFPYSIECKNVESINIWASLKQAETNCLPNTKPLLAFRRNNSPTYIVLRAEDFFQK